MLKLQLLNGEHFGYKVHDLDEAIGFLAEAGVEARRSSDGEYIVVFSWYSLEARVGDYIVIRKVGENTFATPIPKLIAFSLFTPGD